MSEEHNEEFPSVPYGVHQWRPMAMLQLGARSKRGRCVVSLMPTLGTDWIISANDVDEAEVMRLNTSNDVTEMVKAARSMVRGERILGTAPNLEQAMVMGKKFADEWFAAEEKEG
jgi:hypothetical protein